MYNASPAKMPSAYKAAPRTFVPSAPQCPRCDKSVYAAEQALGPGGREYHKGCLTCIACKKTVQPGGFQEHEGDPYCKHCYAKQYGPKGLGYGGAMTGDYVDPVLSRSPYSSPSRSGAFGNHRSSGTFNDTSSRYGNSTSPTKDSNAGSSSPRTKSVSRTSIESPISMYRSSRLQDMEDDMDADHSNSTSQGSGQRINADQQAEAPEFDNDAPRTSSFASSAQPHAQVSSSASFRGSPLKHSLPTERLPPSPTSRRPTSPTSSIGTSATSSSIPSTDNVGVGFKSNLGLLNSSGPDLCRRCQKAVYFAEQVMAGGHKWHKRCLRCVNCNKALDSHLQERDNLPYCKRCYDDHWGLKSQGFVLRPGLH